MAGGQQTYLDFLPTPRHFGDVAHDVFCCHRFPSSAFPTVQMAKQKRCEMVPPEPPIPGPLRWVLELGQGMTVSFGDCGHPLGWGCPGVSV